LADALRAAQFSLTREQSLADIGCMSGSGMNIERDLRDIQQSVTQDV
jgi:hypothetical protein